MGSQASHLLLSPSSMPSTLAVHMAEPMSLDGNEPQQVPPHIQFQPPQQPSTPMQASPYPNTHPGTANSAPTTQAVQQAHFGTHALHSYLTKVLTLPDDDFMGAPPQLPTGCCTPTFAEWNFLPGLWSAAGDNNMGFGPPFRGIELDDLDLRFLDSYNITIPFELGGPPQPEPSQVAPPMGVSGNSHAATSASEAFQNHHWRFRPNQKDHGAAEEHNLSLPSDARDNPSPESHISFARRVTPARLSTAARDNILTIVIKSCRPENLP